MVGLSQVAIFNKHNHLALDTFWYNNNTIQAEIGSMIHFFNYAVGN